MEGDTTLCGSWLPRHCQQWALVWHVSFLGLHESHHSPSHRGSEKHCPVVQLLYLPMPIREGVGTETLNGRVGVGGYSLGSLRIRHHLSSVQQSQHRSEQGATYNFLNRLLMDSAV